MAYRRADADAGSVVEFVTAEIKSRIRRGDFVPGQRLVAADLSQLLAVSGGPIREALTRLAGEGLVDIQPHRGALVRTQTVEEVMEIFNMREVIEGLSARMAARAVATRVASPDKMREIADRGRQLATDLDYIGYARSNHEFHEEIYAISGQPKVTHLAKQLSDQIDRLNNRLLGVPSVLTESAREHDEIAEAIATGNEPRAEAAMRAHVLTSMKKATGRG